jgi:hypothetical protein
MPPKHVLCTLESIPDFKQHPCCLTYFLATAQESKQRKPLTTKVFNRTKRLILGSLQMCPSNFRSNGIPRGVRLPFAPKISLFVLKLYMRKKQWRGHQSQ